MADVQFMAQVERLGADLRRGDAAAGVSVGLKRKPGVLLHERGRQLRRPYYVGPAGGVTVLSRLAIAVTSCAGANGLASKDTIRHTLGRPFLTMSAGHINNGHRRIVLSSSAGDLPAVKLSDQIDVGHDRPILGCAALE